QSGGCVSQLVVALGLFSTRGKCDYATGFPGPVAARHGNQRPAYRNLSLYLFPAQHAPAGRGGSAVLYRNSVPAIAFRSTLEAARLERRAQAGAAAGAGGRVTL